MFRNSVTCVVSGLFGRYKDILLIHKDILLIHKDILLIHKDLL